jgi:hypothetical protein
MSRFKGYYLPRILLSALSFVCLLLVVGCGQSQTASAPLPVSPPHPPTQLPDQHASVGQTITIGGWAITLDSVKYDNNYPLDPSIPRVDGDMVLVLHFTAKNISAQHDIITNGDFSVFYNRTDAEGQQQLRDYQPTPASLAIGGIVPIGRSTSGDIVQSVDPSLNTGTFIVLFHTDDDAVLGNVFKFSLSS